MTAVVTVAPGCWATVSPAAVHWDWSFDYIPVRALRLKIPHSGFSCDVCLWIILLKETAMHIKLCTVCRFIMFVYECFACMYTCVPCVCLVLEEVRESTRPPGTGVARQLWTAMWLLGMEPSPLQEQQVFLVLSPLFSPKIKIEPAYLFNWEEDI